MSQILSEALSMPEDTYHRSRLLTSLIDAFAVVGDLPTVTSIVDTVVAGASLEVRVGAYSGAAKAHHDLGQHLEAASLLDALRAEVDASPEAARRDGHLFELARAWSRIGRYDRAVEAAESIRKPQRRSGALVCVGRNALVANDLVPARDVAALSLRAARLVDDEDFDAIHVPVETFVSSAEFLWDVGLRNEAIAALHEMLAIPDGLCDPTYGPDALEVALRVLATAQDDSGFQRAVAIASELQDSSFRDRALSTAVRELSRAGDIEGAIALAKRFEYESVATIAEAALSAGHREKAIGLLEQVLREVDCLAFDNAEAVVHSRIAHELILRGAVGEAEQVVSVALPAARAMVPTSVSEDIGANGRKALTMAQVALTLSRLGRIEEAVALALDAWEESNPKSPRVRSSISPEAWRALVDMYGRQENVIKLVARVLTRAGQAELVPALARDARHGKVLLKACEGIANELLAAATVPRSQVSALVRSWVEAAGVPADRVGAVNQHLETFFEESSKRRQADEELFQIYELAELDDRQDPPPGGSVASDVLIDPGANLHTGKSDRELGIALARKARSLHRSGRLPESLATWEEAWVVTKNVERKLLLEMLSAAVPALADLDGGKALFQIHAAMQEVSGWWRLVPRQTTTT
jgi:tetratricopeptide (TPR) repeat protein